MSVQPPTLAQSLRRNRYFMAGMVITIFFVIVAFVGLVYLPHDPLQPVGPDYAPPSMQYPFGTTFVGQDVFSQWIFGARSTLLVGFLSALIAMGIGIAIGITAGYISLSDEPLMRFTDVILTLPALPMLITIAAFVRPTIVLTAALIAFLSWPATARVTRSDVLSLKESPYVEVARLSGVPARYIMFRDMLRHILPLVLALALFSVIGAILTEASLDFIGVGPSSAFTWGAMISFANDANAAFVGAWWWFLIPGLSIAMLSTGLAFIAYGVETVLKEA